VPVSSRCACPPVVATTAHPPGGLAQESSPVQPASTPWATAPGSVRGPDLSACPAGKTPSRRSVGQRGIGSPDRRTLHRPQGHRGSPPLCSPCRTRCTSRVVVRASTRSGPCRHRGRGHSAPHNVGRHSRDTEHPAVTPTGAAGSPGVSATGVPAAAGLGHPRRHGADSSAGRRRWAISE
jgi:hypothetical protein